jgi:photosystem II stability/assembly factor-like uncharacterized protein
LGFLFAGRASAQSKSTLPQSSTLESPTRPDFGRALEWTPIGPDGGDARSLSYDPQNPNHILLGTSSGDLFSSTDNGLTWSRLAHLGSGHDLVLDHIVFDPVLKSIYIAAWSIDDISRGDLFRSRDGGRTWQALPGMHNKSIRSFAIAPSNHWSLVAGALDGVFRSTDAGETWQRISPAGHAEIHNIESLAIDPRSPEIIYAGTWHLPWKTQDGGRTWQPMRQGIIDDSDVFSIIIDHANPSTVYLSACSGIYRSDDAGLEFHKVQGIPFSARRTRMLHQDPRDPNVVYAGTTEGLWGTADGGATWKRVSGPNLIVNDISVDPRDSAHVLLATDRSGVLMSTDSALTFAASNRGFVHRQVTALAQDPRDSSTVYAGVVNDKEFGGVFVTHDSGAHWTQRSSGLGGRDVIDLRAAENGTILAGTNDGIFELLPTSAEWRPINEVVNERRITKKIVVKGKRKPVTSTRVEITRGKIQGRVNDLRIEGRQWFAATSQGLFISSNEGRSWHGGPVLGNSNIIALNAAPGQPAMVVPQNDPGLSQIVVAATANRVFISRDEGTTWIEASLPITLVHSVTVMRDSSVWVASREGAYRSIDGGQHWERVEHGLSAPNVVSISADEAGRRMIATTGANIIYESTDGGETWRPTDAGWAIRNVALTRARVLGTTAFEGVVMQAAATERTARVASGGSQQ